MVQVKFDIAIKELDFPIGIGDELNVLQLLKDKKISNIEFLD